MTIINDQLELRVLNTDNFKNFVLEYDDKHYSEIEIKLLYLKGYCNYPVHLISKTLSIRYSETLNMVKKLGDEINNLRADKKLEILLKEKVSSDQLLRAKSKQVRMLIDELDKRAESTDRYKDVTDKQLLELLDKLGTSLNIEHDYHTGHFELGSFPKEKIRGHF